MLINECSARYPTYFSECFFGAVARAYIKEPDAALLISKLHYFLAETSTQAAPKAELWHLVQVPQCNKAVFAIGSYIRLHVDLGKTIEH